MAIRIRRAALAAVLATAIGPASAGALEEGVAAFDQGGYERAADLLAAPADNGDAEALYYLGRIREDGLDGDKDPAAAVDLYTRAAEQDHALAAYNLAVMHYDGRGTERDMEAAFAWFERSAKLGDADAQMQLGTMYKYGIGVEADADKSFRWYRKSALQGNYAAIERMPNTCGVKNIEARIH